MSKRVPAHTPGPWYVGIDKKSVWAKVAKVGTEPCVAIMPSSDHARGDARLIAAAPRMHAEIGADMDALNLIVDHASDPAYVKEVCYQMQARKRAILRDVEGESNG